MQAIEEYKARLDNPVSGGNGAVFFAVCRGKVSEGLDFSDRAGRGVVITGIPYAMKNDAKVGGGGGEKGGGDEYKVSLGLVIHSLIPYGWVRLAFSETGPLLPPGLRLEVLDGSEESPPHHCPPLLPWLPCASLHHHSALIPWACFRHFHRSV